MTGAIQESPCRKIWKSGLSFPVGRTAREYRGNMISRIKLHLSCPCKNWQQARFHLMGIIREFVPKKLQLYVR